MSKFIENPRISTVAAIGAAALFSVLSFGGNAEAASVLSCKGSSASKVKSCCDQIVKENGRPMWMIESGTSCREAAVCKGGGSPLALVAVVAQRCYIKRVYEIMDKNHDRPEKGRSISTRPT